MAVTSWLEFLEGGSLHQIRSKLGLRALPLNLGVRVLAAVLDALDHAHRLTDGEGRPLGVVHRDVSPQNVFVTFDGDVKLIDFGVAKSRDRRTETRVGVVKGSVPYMSPDHVDGSTIDRRADVFAVGVILRELLLGERLWGDADDMAILRCLIRRQLPAFDDASADVPPALRAIAERAMAPRRADRFPNAASMRDALEAYLAEADPRGSLDELGTWMQRHLGPERTAFRDLVRASRGASSWSKAHVWLPSCDLATRFSGPPMLPVPPPPLPVDGVPRASSRVRSLGAGVVFAAALVLAALGLSQPQHRPTGTASLAAADRAPRVVDDVVIASVMTKPATATAEDPDAPSDDPAAPAVHASTLPSSKVHDLPAAVLEERLPPNPYDPAD